MHRVCRLCAAAGVLLLLACALLTVADILGRRLLGWSLPGLIDLTQLLIMGSVFLCIPFAFERRANVEVDLLYGRLPAPLRRLLAAAWLVLSAGFLLVVAWQVAQAAAQVIEYAESSPTIAIPMIWYWVPILFGTILAAIVCIHQLLRRSTHPLHRTEP